MTVSKPLYRHFISSAIKIMVRNLCTVNMIRMVSLRVVRMSVIDSHKSHRAYICNTIEYTGGITCT